MEYPLISEYREAILSSEENFSELSSLRPVLDSHGDPVMSSGNFAVVFKMTDINDGKHYAVKCFIKDQEGRDESYKKIADELEVISSSYILPLRYLENELFVDSSQCDNDEFPVVVMEWVEGETLDSFMNRNLDNKYELEMLSYRFNRMSAWLLAQPFAHGDLKPDNILVRTDGSMVLVDYDGIFVPSMKGEKAREIGSPNYRHPLRTDSDFNEHIDDFSIAVIALSLRAISLNPQLKSQIADVLLLSDSDFRSPATSELLDNIRALTSDSELSLLLGIFYISLAKNSLESLSFRLFMTAKPKQPAKPHRRAKTPVEPIDTSCTWEDIANGIADEFGVIYSPDGTRLLQCRSSIETYTIAKTCKVICDLAFSGIQTLQSVNIPESVTTIGDGAFWGCQSLQSINIPDSVTAIWANPFVSCNSLSITLSKHSQLCIVNGLLIHQSGRLIACLNNSSNICIPESVTVIGDGAFSRCFSLKSVNIPESVTAIGDGAFSDCKSLQSINIPESVTAIGDRAFS
ncbi:MAG: leucine-rich repeat protein, partial [Muribaculaceae bacterium]|nr:leucine-rich repeat protein [Muribaculaceae bacterium]